MTVLSREQVAEIRSCVMSGRSWEAEHGGVLALCDTAAWVMAGREEADRAIDAAHSELNYLIEQIPGASVSTSEESELGERVAELCHGVVEPLVAELDTLRAIVRRVADGWRPSTRGHWTRIVDDSIRVEPMPDAEVRAIYGPQEETE